MKKSRFTESQIVAVLKEGEAGVELTRFDGHLNRFDYGSELEVFNGQETTGV